MNPCSVHDRRWAQAKRAVLTLALAFVFALVFYTCNTPLGAWIGSDNAMYLTMGTALANGYAPYSEIFDHKGPLLFILQMLPQLFTSGYSTLAVFMLLPFHTDVRMTLLISAATPVGANVAVYAQMYDSDYPYACQTVALTTILSIVMMPPFILLATHLLGI